MVARWNWGCGGSFGTGPGDVVVKYNHGCDGSLVELQTA